MGESKIICTLKWLAFNIPIISGALRGDRGVGRGTTRIILPFCGPVYEQNLHRLDCGGSLVRIIVCRGQ